MTNIKKLSFIIPCFNSNRYIRECIDSLYKQDILEEYYEIVAVNDDSTDNTKEILLEYQYNHKNFIIIDHEQNKGQGSARNTGLSFAKGDYIWYIDHDDYIQSNILSFLLHLLNENNLDLLQFNYTEVDEKGESIKMIKTGNSEIDNISGIEFVNSLGSYFLNSYNMSVWARIYNRKFLVNNKFKFDKIRIFEDLEYSLRTLLFADKIKLIENHLYYYRIHNASTMKIFEKTIKGDFIYFSSICSGLNLIKLGIELRTKDSSVSHLICDGGIWRLNSMKKQILLSTSQSRRLFYSLLKVNDEREKIYEFCNSFNFVLLKYPVLSSSVLFFISPFLRFVKKIRVNRHLWILK